MEFRIDLSREELEALDGYAFRKMCRLEEAGLSDALCHDMFLKLHLEIGKALKDASRE